MNRHGTIELNGKRYFTVYKNIKIDITNDIMKLLEAEKEKYIKRIRETDMLVDKQLHVMVQIKNIIDRHLTIG